MQWIRSHLSFANSISVIALFVALGGTSIAAVIAKNSVGSAQVKKNSLKAADIGRNAVGASEIRSSSVRGGDVGDGSIGSLDIGDNAVGSGELSDNSVGSGELGANSVGNSEMGDNAVGSGEVGNDSLTADDIQGSTLDGEVGPDAFARVGSTGALDGGTPAQNKGIVAENVVKPAATTGVYCFGGLPFTPRSGMVTIDAAMATTTSHKVAGLSMQRGNNLGDCPATHQQARVTILSWTDAVAPALSNHGFYIWFES